jgi:hypothetical protein
VVAHDLLVKVDDAGSLADESPFGLEPGEVFEGFGVDLGGVGVGVAREIDLGAVYVKECERIAGGEGGSFVTVYDVVRDAGDLRGELGEGTEALKGADTQHGAGRVAQGANNLN